MLAFELFVLVVSGANNYNLFPNLPAANNFSISAHREN